METDPGGNGRVGRQGLYGDRARGRAPAGGLHPAQAGLSGAPELADGVAGGGPPGGVHGRRRRGLRKDPRTWSHARRNCPN